MDKEVVIDNLLELVRYSRRMADDALFSESGVVIVSVEDMEEIVRLIEWFDDLPYEHELMYLTSEEKVAMAFGREIDE